MGIGRLRDISLLALEREMMDSIPKIEVIDYFNNIKSPNVLH